MTEHGIQHVWPACERVLVGFDHRPHTREVIRVRSRDIAKTLVEIARERRATQLVLGQPARSHWEEQLRGSIINRLLRLSTDIDIHLVPRSRDVEERR